MSRPVDIDWLHLAIGLAGAVFGGASGLVAGVWRVARIDQAIRIDFDKSIDAAEKKVEAKVETLVDQFQEAFSGLRRQIDDHKLHTEESFVRKDDFKDFREEYRQDMRRVFEKLDRPARGR